MTRPRQAFLVPGYTLRREGFCTGDFLLERDDGNVIARATKPSVFQCTFDVELPNRVMTLRKPSIWNRRFALFDGEKRARPLHQAENTSGGRFLLARLMSWNS